MNGRLMRTMAALMLAGSLQAAMAQDDGVPPLPRHMIEQTGTLSRVDVARRMVWIGNKPYKVAPETKAYVGSRPMQDLRQLQVGHEMAFTAGAGGTLTALWMDLPDTDATETRGKGERR